MQNSVVYGVAILISSLIYLFLIMPLDFSQITHYNTLLKLGILSVIVIVPLMLAWIYIWKGIIAFFLAIPFYLVGLFFLYRGSTEEILLVFYYSFAENRANLTGMENFLLYILFSLLGIIVALIMVTPKEK